MHATRMLRVNIVCNLNDKSVIEFPKSKYLADRIDVMKKNRDIEKGSQLLLKYVLAKLFIVLILLYILIIVAEMNDYIKYTIHIY